jgi:hypothetical protein
MAPWVKTTHGATLICEWHRESYRHMVPGGTVGQIDTGTMSQIDTPKKPTNRSYSVTYSPLTLRVRNGRNHLGTVLTHSPKQLKYVGNQQTACAQTER